MSRDSLELHIDFNKNIKKQPFSLQHLSRRVIIICTIKSVGLYNVQHACASLPIPRVLIEFLTNSTQRSEHFDIRTWGSLVELGYSGKCLLYGELVILKCINLKHKLEYLRREAVEFKDAWMGVSHANISRAIVAFRENNTIGAIFEPLPPSLYERISCQRRLEKPRIEEVIIWKVLQQLCSALMYLSARKIDPCKVNSKTISVTENWDVRLHNMLIHYASIDNNAVGQPQFQEIFYGIYTAPERISGSEQGQKKQGTWLMGCIGYEMVHLETAFHWTEGVSLFETLNNVVEGVPPPKLELGNGYSSELIALIRACLNPVASLRPSLHEIHTVLEENCIA